MADARRVLHEVIDSGQQKEQALPSLVIEKSSFEEWWDAMIKSITDFMEQWFPSGSRMGDGTLDYLLMICWYLFFAFVGITLLVYLLRQFRNRSIEEEYSAGERRSQSLSRIDSLLQQALDTHEWAKAMRLRCLLFVVHQGLPSSWTPGSDADLNRERTMSWYRVMYGNTPGDKAIYQQLHDRLLEKEGRS